MTSKITALEAMREVLSAATTPHDCHAMAGKLRKRGLHFQGEELYPWLCGMVRIGEACARTVPDGKFETIVVFEKPITTEGNKQCPQGGNELPKYI